MRVAIISGSIGKDPGYVFCSFVFNEAYWLAKMGVKVHIVRQRIDRDEFLHGMFFHGLSKRVSIQAIKTLLSNIPRYPMISLIRNPLIIYGENRYAYSIARVVKENDVDIIHAHFAYVEGWASLLARRACKRPLVVTLHGYDILVEPSVRFGLRLSKRYSTLINKVVREADAIVVNGPPIYDLALTMVKSLRDFSKVHLIPHGVDLQRFNPFINGGRIKEKLGVEGKFVVFTLKYHEPRYRIEDVIRAAAFIARKGCRDVFS